MTDTQGEALREALEFVRSTMNLREPRDATRWCRALADALAASEARCAQMLAALQAAEQCIGELSPTQARVECMQMIQAATSQSGEQKGEK